MLLGLDTGIGGSIIRDVLAGRPNLLLTRDLYLTSILFGCIIYVALLHWLPEYPQTTSVLSVMLIIGYRAAAILRGFSFPQALTTKRKLP